MSDTTLRRGSRKRALQQQPVPNDGDESDNEIPNYHFDENEIVVQNALVSDPSTNYISQRAKISAKDRGFGSLPRAAQDQCIKAVTRLFLTKAARKETLPKTLVRDVLAKIDQVYKQHTDTVLQRVQTELYETFGYALICPKDVIGLPAEKKDEFYLSNALQSKKLREILSATQTPLSCAYNALLVIVCLVIYMSPCRQATGEEISERIRMIDDRFPASYISGTGKKASTSASAVPELGEDLPKLLQRMQREHYITVMKESNEVRGDGPASYTLGARFHLDISRTQLVNLYFMLNGEAADQAMLQEIAQENLAEQEGEDQEEEEQQ